MSRILIAGAALCLLQACTIVQTIEPANLERNAELCVVENPAVREGFLQELQSRLEAKSIRYRLVSNTNSRTECEWLMTYTANWRWDLALYMSYANLRVYHNGALDGEAIYDASGGGGSMDKFIDAETKIGELIDQLF